MSYFRIRIFILRIGLIILIKSIIYKQTIGNAPDAEIMNQVVEDMVRKAISVTGVESIVDENKTTDIFNDAFLNELENVKMPINED